MRGAIILFTLFLIACQPQEHDDKLDEFILHEGFQIDLVASEPLLDSAVAMTFGDDGSIWAVELPGYMRDIEGSEEEKADGKIVRLIDSNADGVMDDRIIVKDGLIAPRAIALIYGGLLYTEGSNLWWENLKQAKNSVLVDSLYVVGGNIEHRSNGLLYNIDNWIYSAKSNARYRRIGNKWIKEPTQFRGQWGITHDDMGRLFYNDNSNPLFGDYTPPNVLIKNPYQKAKHGLHQVIAEDKRLFPVQANDVNRGYQPGVLDTFGRIKNFTSACGPLIFKSHELGHDLYGDAFVCGPEANLVKRYKIDQIGAEIKATQAYENDEFLVSTDESFRPVNLYTGYDGALYILDLRKGVIQHRAYMTSYLRQIIQDKKLDQIVGKGRIYRVTKKGFQSKDKILLKNTNQALQWLQSDIGTKRIMAQKKLIAENNLEVKNQLEKIAQDFSNPFGQIHALWTLEGLGILNQNLLIDIANNEVSKELMYQLILLIDHDKNANFLTKWSGTDQNIDLLISHYSGQLKDRTLWASMATKYRNNVAFAESLISGIDTSQLEIWLSELNSFSADTVYSMLQEAVNNMKHHEWKAPLPPVKLFKDNRTAGLDLYEQYCSSCHGLDGLGRDNLAPPIMQSEYVNGPVDQLIMILLHGLKGPINVKGQMYEMNLVMPGIKDNSSLTDKDIADIIIFIRNSFSFADPGVATQQVTTIREKTKDRTEMMTEEELKVLFESKN